MSDREYYDNLISLFASDGWKLYQEDLEDNLKALHDVSSIKDVEQFWKRKGQVELLTRLIGYQALIEEHYEFTYGDQSV
jgi:hypothetical protein